MTRCVVGLLRHSPAPSGGALPVRGTVPCSRCGRLSHYSPSLTDALCCTWRWLAMTGRHGVPGEEEARGQGEWRGGKVHALIVCRHSHHAPACSLFCRTLLH